MGWGAAAIPKREMIANSAKYYTKTAPRPAFKRVVVDCNAIIRNLAMGNVTPYMVIKRLWKKCVLNHKSTPTHYYFAFDTAGKMHPCHKKFYLTRRNKPTKREPTENELKINGNIYKKTALPLPDNQIAHITAKSLPFQNTHHQIPVSYDQIWSNPAAKAKMWTVFANILCEDFIDRIAPPNTRFCVDMPGDDQGLVCRPRAFKNELVLNGMGEADCKCSEYIRTYAAPTYTNDGNIIPYNKNKCNYISDDMKYRTIIHTTDWDMAIQAQALFGKNVSIEFGGRVWRVKDTNELKFSTAAAAKHKTDDVIEVYTSQGANPTISLMMLCCGGVDYCLGIQRFGFRVEHIIPYVTGEEHLPPIITITGHNPRTATLNVSLFLLVLCEIGLNSARCKSPELFSAELWDMYFCVLYFLGFDMKIGGPRLDVSENLFADIPSIKLLLENAGTEKHDNITYTEQHY
jgi:hypothetical protein